MHFINFVTPWDRSENASSGDDEHSKELNPRKNLEEEYLDYEAKVQIMFKFSLDFNCSYVKLSSSWSTLVRKKNLIYNC